MKPTRLILTLTLVAFLLPGTAQADTNEKRFTYPMADIWSTAVRLLAADLSYRIKDKDKESGYIRFIYPGSTKGQGKAKAKEHGGAMQFVSFVDPEGYRKVRVMLEIADQPSYIEVQILDKLERKLRSEQGSPPDAEKVKKKKKKKEAGARNEDGADKGNEKK